MGFFTFFLLPQRCDGVDLWLLQLLGLQLRQSLPRIQRIVDFTQYYLSLTRNPHGGRPVHRHWYAYFIISNARVVSAAVNVA